MVDVTLHLQVEELLYEEAVEQAEQEGRAIEEVLKEKLLIHPSPFFISPNCSQMQKEEEAFEAQRSELWTRYPNEYVAFHKGQMIARDTDELDLIDLVRALYPEPAVILIKQVLAAEAPPLQFRSALWARGEG